MAAVDLEHRPALGAAALRGVLEAKALAHDEGAGNALGGDGPDRLTEAADGERRQARPHPLRFRGIADAEHLGRHRGHLVALARRHRLALPALAELRGIQIEGALAVSRDER